MILKIRLFTSLVLLLGLTEQINAYEIQISKSDDVVRWEESCFHYTLHEDGSDDVPMNALREAVQKSFRTWEDVPCSYFRFVETERDATCSPIGFDLTRPNMNLLVWREEDWITDRDHSQNVMALTTLSYDDNSGRILDADIEFNGEFFDFSVSKSGRPGLADIQNTATHEIGHTLGLEHSRIKSATMAPTAETGDTNKRDLDQDDIDGICYLYPIDEDLDICKEPYCGLDQHCEAPPRCETGDGIETNPATMREPTTGCSVSYFQPQNAGIFTFLSQLVLTNID